MKIRAATTAAALLILFTIGILGARLAGVWKTESSKVPSKLSSGEFAGEYNPGDIRGSYTFADVENAFGIPVEILAEAFGFSSSENPGEIQAKEFETVYTPADNWEVGTDSLRLFTALYTALPHTPEETTALPGSAARILRDKGSLTEEQLALVKERTVSLETFISDSTITMDTEEHDENEDTTVKGKTLFSDVLDWGVTQKEIENILGIKMGNRTTPIRDFCTEQGLEFGEIKVELQEIIDSRQ